MQFRRSMPLKRRVKLIRNNLSALLKLKDVKKVSIEYGDEVVKIKAVDGDIWTVSNNNWSRYRHGIKEKQERLIKRYGIDNFKISAGAIIDVGANVGEISTYFAERGNMVYAIEPDPITLFCLIQNVKKYDNIKVINEVLWKRREIIPFHLAHKDSDSSIIKNESSCGYFAREAMTLDDLIANLSIKNISLIKADCEGAEPELLQGGKHALDITQYVALDTGAERGGQKTSVECERILKSAGFRTRVIDLDSSAAVTIGWRE